MYNVNVFKKPDGTTDKATKATVSGPGVTLVDLNTTQTITGAKSFTGNCAVNVQTLAGVGTNAATAGAITASYPALIFATGGNNSVGIILPTAVAGMLYTVKNDDNANGIMKVYPQVNSSINGTANSALSMAANTMGDFYAVDATHWVTNKVPG